MSGMDNDVVKYSLVGAAATDENVILNEPVVLIIRQIVMKRRWAIN